VWLNSPLRVSPRWNQGLVKVHSHQELRVLLQLHLDYQKNFPGIVELGPQFLAMFSSGHQWGFAMLKSLVTWYSHSKVSYFFKTNTRLSVSLPPSLSLWLTCPHIPQQGVAIPLHSQAHTLQERGLCSVQGRRILGTTLYSPYGNYYSEQQLNSEIHDWERKMFLTSRT
jgi:hypothetical protein